MSRASEIVILCEDKLHEVVVRRFLTKGWSVSPRTIRVCPYPEGRGSGESHVRTQLAKEMKAYRARQAATILVAMVDADTGTVAEHQAELDAALTREGVAPRLPGDNVVYLVPKRSIETWLAYLDGEPVVENEPEEQKSGKFRYKAKYGFRGCESKARPLVDRLAESCRKGRALAKPPDSLVVACKEFDRMRGSLGTR